MKKIKLFLRKHWFGVCVFLIILLAAFLRFYDYGNRWGLAYDQAHDWVVAKYAIEHYKLPLLGPFSSAGPFQTGGEWYWIIMFPMILFPFSILSPWVFITLLYVAFVLGMILLGKYLINPTFGIFLGLLSAVSTAQIAQSSNLTNQSPQSVISLLAIISMVFYVRRRKAKYLFLLGFFVALAPTVHLQGASLILLVFFTIIFTGMPSRRAFMGLLSGILIPLIPLIIFDLQNNFLNGGNMIKYLLFEQNKISFEQLGRRWLTYLGVFWPTIWSFVTGGNIMLGYIEIAAVLFVIPLNFIKKKITKEFFILIVSFFAMVVLIRYTRTPLYDSYVVSLHPFILLLTGWAVFSIYRYKKVLGLIVLIVIFSGSFLRTWPGIQGSTNYAALRAEHWTNLLISTYPNEKISLFDYQYRSTSFSFPLIVYLYQEGRIDSSGHRIGFGSGQKDLMVFHKELKENKVGFELWDLNSTPSAQLRKEEWSSINPSDVYYSTQEWYKDN